MNWILKLIRDEDGPTAVEYAVMLAVIGVMQLLVGSRNIGRRGSEGAPSAVKRHRVRTPLPPRSAAMASGAADFTPARLPNVWSS